MAGKSPIKLALYPKKDIPAEIPDHYKEKVIKMLRKLPKESQDAIFETPCFGWLYSEDGEICPLKDECSLAKPCRSVYIQVNGLNRYDVQKMDGKPITPPKKWAGTGKYQRYGYQPKDRPVDHMINVLMENLTPITELPQFWSCQLGQFREKYGRRKLFVSRTASYHSILVNNLDKSGVIAKPQIVCRFWTNAAAAPIVDISEELSNHIADKMTLFEIPEKTKKKASPCTWRIRCITEEDVISLARWIREVYV